MKSLEHFNMLKLQSRYWRLFYISKLAFGPCLSTSEWNLCYGNPSYICIVFTSQLGYFTGVFQALRLVVLVVFWAIGSRINHLPLYIAPFFCISITNKLVCKCNRIFFLIIWNIILKVPVDVYCHISIFIFWFFASQIAFMLTWIFCTPFPIDVILAHF